MKIIFSRKLNFLFLLTLLFSLCPTFGWSQQFNQMIKLIESDRETKSDIARTAYDNFGYSVAIDGDFAVVGSPNEAEDSSGAYTLNQAGAAFIFMKIGTTWKLQQKVVSSDRGAGELFGRYVAISGDYVVVSCPGDGEDSVGKNTIKGAGSVFIFKRNNSVWLQTQKITALDRAHSLGFGGAVGISGSYIIVGNPTDTYDQNGLNAMRGAGSAYIFNRNGEIWTQQAKIVASDRDIDDGFGSVAISGDYVVVGASGDDLLGSPAFYSNGGCAYVFKRTGVLWQEQQKIVPDVRNGGDYFGSAVAIDGDYLVVGAQLGDLDAAGLNYKKDAGAAYIFHRNVNTWTQQQMIVASDRTAGASFGTVDISGDYVIVGALYKDEVRDGILRPGAGSAYIFKRSGTTWAEQSKIVASDRDTSSFFGCSVGISGDYALVGAYAEGVDSTTLLRMSNAGAAYIFNRNGTSWSQQYKLVTIDRVPNDQFGYSVAIKGNYAIVGAPLEDEDVAGTNPLGDAGAAYIFYKSGNNWAFQQKIVASDRTIIGNFGNAVSISGDYAIVGAFQNDKNATGANVLAGSGAAYIFHRNGTVWTQQQKLVATDRDSGDFFGVSVGISGDYAIIGAYQGDKDSAGLNKMTNAGAAYIFKRNGTTWAQQKKMVASDRSPFDYFGSAVAIDGSTAIVSAPLDAEDASGGNGKASAGSVYIFNLSGTTWTQTQKIVANDRGINDSFGNAVGINGDYLIVGALHDEKDLSGNYPTFDAGCAYIFKRNGNTWAQQQKLIAADREKFDEFGSSVGIYGDYAVVGSPFDNEDAKGMNIIKHSGSSYIFKRNGTTWAQLQKIAAADRSVVNNFGNAVAIDSVYVMVGAFQDDKDTAGGKILLGAGSVYVFSRLYPNEIAVFQGNSKQNSVEISPNPTAGNILITNKNQELNNTTAVVENLLGQKVYQFKLQSFNSIDLSHLPSGMYLLKLANGEGVRMVKR
ncbi:MAG: T9SS type A sorting domain-containing protein [Chitinophagaceae bacterium]